MKSFICACIIFICFIIASSFYNHQLEMSAEQFEKQISSFELTVKSNNQEDAEKKLAELEKGWNELQSWLKAIIGHYDIHSIEQALCEIKGYTDAQKKDEILVRTELLKLLIQRIVTNEKPTFSNIL